MNKYSFLGYRFFFAFSPIVNLPFLYNKTDLRNSLLLNFKNLNFPFSIVQQEEFVVPKSIPTLKFDNYSPYLNLSKSLKNTFKESRLFFNIL